MLLGLAPELQRLLSAQLLDTHAEAIGFGLASEFLPALPVLLAQLGSALTSMWLHSPSPTRRLVAVPGILLFDILFCQNCPPSRSVKLFGSAGDGLVVDPAVALPVCSANEVASVLEGRMCLLFGRRLGTLFDSIFFVRRHVLSSRFVIGLASNALPREYYTQQPLSISDTHTI